jgi:hypothetical protein
MRRAAPLLVAAAACASGAVPLDATSRSRLAESEVVRAVYRPASFSVRTPGGVLAGGGGALGALVSEGIAGHRGEATRGRHGLGDPALRVAEQVGKTLQADLGVGRVVVEQDPVPEDAPAGSGLLLDVRTEQWRLLYFPTDWSHYRVAYQASTRLVDPGRSAVLWQSSCDVLGSDLSESPTLEELEANDAALLRVKFDEVADECARQLRGALAGGGA